MWTPLYQHTKFQSFMALSLAMTNITSRSCVWAPSLLLLLLPQARTWFLWAQTSLLQREKNHTMMFHYWKVVFRQITHLISICLWGNLPKVWSPSSHIFAGLQNIFIINVIYSHLHTPNQCRQPSRYRKNRNCFEFRLAHVLSSF